MLYSLKNDSDFEFIVGERGVLILKKDNPDRDSLIKIVT